MVFFQTFKVQSNFLELQAKRYSFLLKLLVLQRRCWSRWCTTEVAQSDAYYNLSRVWASDNLVETGQHQDAEKQVLICIAQSFCQKNILWHKFELWPSIGWNQLHHSCLCLTVDHSINNRQYTIRSSTFKQLKETNILKRTGSYGSKRVTQMCMLNSLEKYMTRPTLVATALKIMSRLPATK